MENFVTAVLALSQSPLLIFLASVAVGLGVGVLVGMIALSRRN
jgi:hypothetical protein